MEEKFKQEPSSIIKVVLFGPESTGKTTLSQDLAKHYNTVWVPEYAREYLQDKWDREGKTCEPKDLLPIAEGQIKLENSLAKKANEILNAQAPFPELREGFSDISLLKKYEHVINIILQDTFPEVLTNNEIKTASLPLDDVIFNSSKRFKKILENAGGKDFEPKLISNFLYT